MLRQITYPQFQDWRVYSELQPFGEARQDRRFAVLAEIVAAAFRVQTTDEKPVDADTFLRLLAPRVETASSAEPPKVEKKQTVEEMTAYLQMWIDGSNQVIREEAKLPPSQRTIT